MCEIHEVGLFFLCMGQVELLCVMSLLYLVGLLCVMSLLYLVGLLCVLSLLYLIGLLVFQSWFKSFDSSFDSHEKAGT